MEPAPPLWGTGREWLFFLEAPNELIRINAGPDLRFRLLSAQAASPIQLTLLKAINAPECTGKIVRNVFAPLAAHGEWFRSAPPLRTFIDALEDRAIVSAAVVDGWIADYAEKRFFAADYWKPRARRA